MNPESVNTRIEQQKAIREAEHLANQQLAIIGNQILDAWAVLNIIEDES